MTVTFGFCIPASRRALTMPIVTLLGRALAYCGGFSGPVLSGPGFN